MCGETKGYGFALWRMDLTFGSPKKVLSQLSGCCGQMDVQVQGDKIYVAENTRHRVAIFDRDGKAAGAFGGKGRESKGAEFGGCCNPMNCRITSDGDVYTAESEGIVKKFNAKGEFVAHIGTVKLTGGCKNVAVAASPQGDKVYFCDLPGSRFLVLEQSTKAPVRAAASN
jgi:sugar lactone lactonase YvrE